MNATRLETTARSLVGAALLLAGVMPCGLVAQSRYESITWTPDGNALSVAWRGDSTASDLYVLPLGEGAVRRLTEDPARDAFASWTPDGTAVAFASNRTGRGDIYVAAGDGSNLRRLTQSDSADSWPSSAAVITQAARCASVGQTWGRRSRGWRSASRRRTASLPDPRRLRWSNTDSRS